MRHHARRHAALSLADALLAGDADGPALMRAANRALGREWPWLAGLCRWIVAWTGTYFHDFSRDELASAIEAYEPYAAAWGGGDHPHVTGYCLDLPRAGYRPEWAAELALPELPTVADLAAWLGTDANELAWFGDAWRDDNGAGSPLRHYHYRWVEKRSGGLRLIEIPKARLRAMQRRILRSLLDRVPPHPAAHGFRPRRSCLTHAAGHAGQAVVMRMDLKDFFPSIPAARIHALFARLGYSLGVARLLTAICTNRTPSDVAHAREARRELTFGERQVLRNRHLPQGAPTSPALANLCAFRLDVRLMALADSVGARYTRYADDLAFSGGKAFGAAARRFHVQVAAIALEEGFVLNTRKTRIMGAGTRQQLTGIVVNRHPNLARRDYDALKATLHNCARFGPASQNRARLPDFRAHLLGRISHLQMINPERAARLRRLFDRIDWG